MLPNWFVFVAIAIRLAGGAGYIRSTIKGRAKPNPITWFIWALTALVAFAAQITEGVGIQALMTCALAVGPLIIFCISLRVSRDASHFTFFNVCCGVLAIVGVILWQATSNALLAIICSILADMCGSLPTVRKAYRDPHGETALPFLLSIASMVITLATIKQWTIAAAAFPAYILCINAVIYGAIAYGHHSLTPVEERKKRKRYKRDQV